MCGEGIGNPADTRSGTIKWVGIKGILSIRSTQFTDNSVIYETCDVTCVYVVTVGWADDFLAGVLAKLRLLSRKA